MKQPPKNAHPHRQAVRPTPDVDAIKQKQKAETAEVLGRHKNAGQKDHKGAR